MNVNELKSKIKSNTIPNFLIFTGEEIQIQRIYRNKIAETLKLPLIYCDTVKDVYGKINNNSFITTTCCYVVFEDKEFASEEKLWQLIKSKLKNNILILQYSKIDKRGKFYKQNDVVEFEKLDERLLVKYVQRDCNLNESNALDLINICENDYSRILLEIDKINNINGDSNTVYKKLVNEGTIYKPPYDAIFDFVDAVLRRNGNLSFELLKISYDLGENTLTLLSALYLNTKQVLQVQSCTSSDICKSTGLTSFQVKCSREKSNYYSNGELVSLLKRIGETERGIKSGIIEEKYAIPNLLINTL